MAPSPAAAGPKPWAASAKRTGRLDGPATARPKAALSPRPGQWFGSIEGSARSTVRPGPTWATAATTLPPLASTGRAAPLSRHDPVPAPLVLLTPPSSGTGTTGWAVAVPPGAH